MKSEGELKQEVKTYTFGKTRFQNGVPVKIWEVRLLIKTARHALPHSLRNVCLSVQREEVSSV